MESYLEKSSLDLRLSNQAIPPKILDQVPVRGPGAAPRHLGDVDEELSYIFGEGHLLICVKVTI